MKSKICDVCRATFKKRYTQGYLDWKKQRFCSYNCYHKKHVRKPLEDRFWGFVRKTKKCWKWTGTMDKKGYGRIKDVDLRTPLKAHRVSWEMHYGPIYDGLDICHACDNPSCVNPSHLMMGSRMANLIDSGKKGRTSRVSLKNLIREGLKS